MNTNYEKLFNNVRETKINKVEELLKPKEKILWKGRPKKASYILDKTISIMPVAIIWLIIDCSILFTISGYDMGSSIWFFIIPFFALHLAPVWIWLAKVIKAYNEIKKRMYVVTNKRILDVRGGNFYVFNEIPLDELYSVQLSKKTIDKMLFVGDIYLKGTSGVIVMYDIPKCDFIYKKLDYIVNNAEGRLEFYTDGLECEHCGTIFPKTLKRCPSCGAPIKREN